MQFDDFWGIAPENAADHAWQDFSAFKRKVGGMEVNLVPTLDHVYNQAAYAEYLADTDDRNDDEVGTEVVCEERLAVS